MRVLMLIHHVAAAGGSFERSFALARHLVRLGHTVTLSVSPSRASATPRVRELQGVRLVESADVAPFHLRNMGLSPLDILGRMVLATHESFDVVHGFDQRPSVSLPALAQRKRFGSPYVSDWADLWGGQGIAGERSWPARVTLGAFDGACEKRVCQSADGLTPICTYLAERARAMGVAGERLHLLPVGAECDDGPPPDKAASRRALGIPLQAPVAVHIGLGSYDLALLVQSFVAMARVNPRALLVTSGPRISQLDRAARRYGLAANLHQVGWVPHEHLSALLGAADMLLLPYTRRPVNLGRSPNSAGHALAAARPIVTNPTGDLGALVRDEGIGLTAEETGAAMAQALQQLFDDPPQAEAMGRRARALAETRLAWSHLAGRLAEFYTRCTSP